MPMPLCGELVDQRKIKRGAIGEINLELIEATFEHVIENRAAPVLCGFAFAGRAVFEHVAFVGLGIVPAKSAPFENRMQGIDENTGAGNIQTACSTALAEATDKIVLGQAGETLFDQPIHQAQAGREFHTVLCRVIMRDERSQRRPADRLCAAGSTLDARPSVIFLASRSRRLLSRRSRRDGRATRARLPTAGKAACLSRSRQAAG